MTAHKPSLSRFNGRLFTSIEAFVIPGTQTKGGVNVVLKMFRYRDACLIQSH
jgi:hypothetical protein